MTESQKASRKATKAGVEADAEMTEEGVRAQVQRNKRFRDAGSVEVSPLDGPALIRQAFESWNAERAEYEKKHGKPMPLPEVW